MDYSRIYFQVLCGVLIESIQSIFHIICYNVITSTHHTTCEKYKGEKKGFSIYFQVNTLPDTVRLDDTSLEEASLSAMGSKPL